MWVQYYCKVSARTLAGEMEQDEEGEEEPREGVAMGNVVWGACQGPCAAFAGGERRRRSVRGQPPACLVTVTWIILQNRALLTTIWRLIQNVALATHHHEMCDGHQSFSRL